MVDGGVGADLCDEVGMDQDDVHHFLAAPGRSEAHPRPGMGRVRGGEVLCDQAGRFGTQGAGAAGGSEGAVGGRGGLGEGAGGG